MRAKWAERFLCLFWNNAQICLLKSFRFVVSLLFCSSHFFLSHPEGALARLSAHQKVYCWLHLFLPSLSILITKRSLSEVISLSAMRSKVPKLISYRQKCYSSSSKSVNTGPYLCFAGSSKTSGLNLPRFRIHMWIDSIFYAVQIF